MELTILSHQKRKYSKIIMFCFIMMCGTLQTKVFIVIGLYIILLIQFFFGNKWYIVMFEKLKSEVITQIPPVSVINRLTIITGVSYEHTILKENVT